MDVLRTSLDGVFVITPKRFNDNRGFFTETYNKQRLIEAGLNLEFVQDNVSFSEAQGTVRGLHFQRPPFGQAKLVSVLKGAVLDVAVDLRRTSSTFIQHIAVPLSVNEGNQLFIPEGFAHGFITLTPRTLLLYKVSNYYSPDHD